MPPIPQIPDFITETQLFLQTIVRLKEGWTKERYARDPNGSEVPPCDRHAICWCLRGAMTRSFFDLTGVDPLHLSFTHKLRIPLNNVRMHVEWVVEELIGRPDVVVCNDEYLLHGQEAIAIVERANRQFDAH